MLNRTGLNCRTNQFFLYKFINLTRLPPSPSPLLVNMGLKWNIVTKGVDVLNPLSVNLTKWSNTLKHSASKLRTNCLSVFDHFVGLVCKRLSHFMSVVSFYSLIRKPLVFCFQVVKKENSGIKCFEIMIAKCFLEFQVYQIICNISKV